eukprot:SAG31_NODE_245_length_19224_cov_10.210614_1_plen_138_part_00
MAEMAGSYDPAEVEKCWGDFWEKEGLMGADADTVLSDTSDTEKFVMVSRKAAPEHSARNVSADRVVDKPARVRLGHSSAQRYWLAPSWACADYCDRGLPHALAPHAGAPHTLGARDRSCRHCYTGGGGEDDHETGRI